MYVRCPLPGGKISSKHDDPRHAYNVDRIYISILAVFDIPEDIFMIAGLKCIDCFQNGSLCIVHCALTEMTSHRWEFESPDEIL